MIIYIPGEIKTFTEFVHSELVDDLRPSLNINHGRPPSCQDGTKHYHSSHSTETVNVPVPGIMELYEIYLIGKG